MNYLKSFAKKFYESATGVKFRNTIGFRPAILKHPSSSESYSSSDLFFWRTDNDFTTLFNISNIPSTYYKLENIPVLIIFYDKNGNEIKRELLNFESSSKQIEIDSNYLGGIKATGTFCVFHQLSDTKEIIQITNRCYTGFRKKDGIASFVHGNFDARYETFPTKKIKADIVQTSLRPTIYRLQKNFQGIDHSELAFCNPTKQKIWLEVADKSRVYLDSGQSILVEVSNRPIVEIKSSLCLPRPVVFSYKGDFFDCHHG